MPRTLRARAIALVVVTVCLSSMAAGAASAQTQPSAPLSPPMFRLERLPVSNGAELFTLFGRPEPGDAHRGTSDATEIPLVSVLRDSFGDDDKENDRLRYVWVHGFTRPSAGQRIASAIPFMNRRTGNKIPDGSESIPPSVVDLGSQNQALWKSAFWYAANVALFDPYGVLVKTSVRAFRRNDDDYRTAHIIRAMSILSLYEGDQPETHALSSNELRDIQARLVLAQKTLGGLVNDVYLREVHEREIASTRDVRGHNWELLRQRVEAEGLYFDPLAMPDGSATHVLVWVPRSAAEVKRPFNKRFLNIRTPWGDKRLREWTGHTETRHVDAHGALVPADTPGATETELVPLALYGLDHPKIPVVLIDFRDHSNPKRREVSRRILHDITRNVLSLSPYGDLEYFAGQSVYNFVTGRRGMDINQPSRLRSYSQLKLLLSLNDTLDPEFAKETSRLIERVSMNPLQNDLEVERLLAEQSYAALVTAASAPGGLGKRVAGDRRKEFTALNHNLAERILLRAATIATLGEYRHREPQPEAEQLERVDVARRLAHHRRFLDETLASTPVVEVTASVDDVRHSLGYLMEHGARTDEGIVRIASRLFAQTQDAAIRRLSLDTLAHMETDSARRQLLAIYRNPENAVEWRMAARQLLQAPNDANTPALTDGAPLAQAAGTSD